MLGAGASYASPTAKGEWFKKNPWHISRCWSKIGGETIHI